MPAVAVSGKNTNVVLGSSTFCARTWSITDDQDILDGTTTCDNGWKSYVEGLSGYTGTVMGYTFVVVSPQPTYVNISDSEFSISGSAFVKTDPSGSVDGLEEFTYNLTFTGEVTVA